MMRWHTLRVSGSRDVRWRALAVTVTVIAAGGLVIASVSDSRLFGPRVVAPGAPVATQSDATARARQEIHQRFQQGVIMLHAKQHEHAMTAFHRVLELDPAMPEAHVNMGFALIGLERYGAARDFFESAIALRKEQVNAYYGLAVALDGLRDRPAAIGAMRTFVHLSRPDDPYQRKAQAALWEWEAERDAGGAAAGPARAR
jgi:tetratricopeptide (TPR) repeat protein